jgi:predicted nucleotidyltransferase
MTTASLKKSIANAVAGNTEYQAIKKLSPFGSQLTNSAKADSDIDLLVEFEPGIQMSFFKLARIQRALEEKVGKPIDLVTADALSKYFRNEIIHNAELIYER